MTTLSPIPDDLAARLLAMFVEELADQLGAANQHILALEKDPGEPEQLKALFRIMHTLKGAARSAGVEEAERAAHRLEGLLAAARDHARALSRGELDDLFAGIDQLAAILASLGARRVAPPDEAGAPPSAAPSAATAPLGSTSPTAESVLRVAQERVDELLGMSNRLLIVADRFGELNDEMQQLNESAARATTIWRRLRRLVASGSAADGLKEDLDALEGALDATRRTSHAVLGEMSTTSGGLGRISSELTRSVRELRMRPFADALVDLPRLARDVAAATGKHVELHSGGEQVQADRVVLAQLHEALMHLVRNAVDHGIEPPDVRRARGKPDTGHVRVTASLVRDRIIVTVADDGAGLDLTSLRARLAERGEQVPEDDRALARRLFSGGLSTRGAATTFSGRGVGLDVVRAAAERIRGAVDVTTTPGRGTTFVIDAPLTLATLRAVLVNVSGAVVAIPSAFVERLMRATADQMRVVEGRPAVPTDGAPAMVASLAAILGPPLVDRPVEGPLKLVLVRYGERAVALRVDEVLEELEVVVRPIRAHGGEPLPHVSGAAMLASGSVALVLNVTAAVATALGFTAAESTLATAPERVAPRRRVVVVDDSITTRTLLASVLEAAGYDVLTAVDGADAWRILQERGADLVVSDVEMPRMDGFQLTEAIRGTSRFRELPVILVTAMETQEHRARGMEAGADAYLGKSSFEQEGLLTTVRDLIG